MSWFILILAGLLEVCWAVGLKYTEGFTKPIASALVAVAIVGSMVLLGIAVRTLPVGTAYSVWVGIGILGAVVAEWWLFAVPMPPVRIFFLAMLLIGVVGLKVTASSTE